MLNGHHPQNSNQGHNFQDTVTGLNGYNKTHHANQSPPYLRRNGQAPNGNANIIQLNGLPEVSPNSRIISVDGRSNGQIKEITSNGHSPISTTSIPAEEMNNENERQEEQRKEDRWGTLKKGLKYNHLKGIITGKFGKHDAKDDKVSSQSKIIGPKCTRGSSRESSPSKPGKPTNVAFQATIDKNPSRLLHTGPIETNLCTSNAMEDSPSKQPNGGLNYGSQLSNGLGSNTPSTNGIIHGSQQQNSHSHHIQQTNGFMHGNQSSNAMANKLPANHIPTNETQLETGFSHGSQFRSSVVHFNLPSSPNITQQRGGSTRVQNNSVSDTLAGRRSESYQQLTQDSLQNTNRNQLPIHQSQQQLWRQQQTNQLQHSHYSADNITDAIPSDHTYGPNGRTNGATSSGK